jgi:hypothetical protein
MRQDAECTRRYHTGMPGCTCPPGQRCAANTRHSHRAATQRDHTATVCATHRCQLARRRRFAAELDAHAAGTVRARCALLTLCTCISDNKMQRQRFKLPPHTDTHKRTCHGHEHCAPCRACRRGSCTRRCCTASGWCTLRPARPAPHIHVHTQDTHRQAFYSVASAVPQHEHANTHRRLLARLCCFDGELSARPGGAVRVRITPPPLHTPQQRRRYTRTPSTAHSSTRLHTRTRGSVHRDPVHWPLPHCDAVEHVSPCAITPQSKS